MVTFRKFASDCFDTSNSWRLKHGLFEDSPYVENVKNNSGTLQRGAYAQVLSGEISR